MRVLFVIPARGGSKGVPGKNIKLLAGRPLIAYTLDAAKAVSSFEDICVSTDSLEIKDVVEREGVPVPFLRPAELATDTATSESVLLHALDYYEQNGKTYEYVVMLQATSPLRTGKHLHEALKMIDGQTEMVVSVKETDSNPYYVLCEEDGDGFLRLSKESSFTRRQDCPVVYELNGAIYIMDVNALRKKGMRLLNRRKFLMDGIYSIDIDTALQFDIAELIINKYVPKVQTSSDF